MAEKKQKFVSTALVIAHDSEGRDVYLYQGAPLPEGLAEGEAKRLDEGGFLSDTQDVSTGNALGDFGVRPV